jgi:hypothetical protein
MVPTGLLSRGEEDIERPRALLLTISAWSDAEEAGDTDPGDARNEATEVI